jgi:mRNA-degrading endonuclease toxin of MazEF toxin-antitoxin module
MRGIPSEITLGSAEGLSRDCVASFDNLGPLRVGLLTSRAGRLAFAQRRICAALEALADC